MNERTKSLFNTSLIGLFDTVVFRQQIEAHDKYHAIRIAAAIYDGCFKKGEAIKVLPEAVIPVGYLHTLRNMLRYVYLNISAKIFRLITKLP